MSYGAGLLKLNISQFTGASCSLPCEAIQDSKALPASVKVRLQNGRLMNCFFRALF